eukprot:TRINITY_DN16687_c0_g1_i1.p2 TRINITY_DN16687_c0_g1~~TRINITY_DN16687_c0_g1_i1.p2  ORF type:complete len:160 (+),score=14.99 TRINITY_DN16687_c0_g1_i1:74-553(+)
MPGGGRHEAYLTCAEGSSKRFTTIMSLSCRASSVQHKWGVTPPTAPPSARCGARATPRRRPAPHGSAQYKTVEVVSAMRVAGAIVRVEDRAERAVLHASAFLARPVVVCLLLATLADIFAVEKSDCTCRHAATPARSSVPRWIGWVVSVRLDAGVVVDV